MPFRPLQPTAPAAKPTSGFRPLNTAGVSPHQDPYGFINQQSEVQTQPVKPGGFFSNLNDSVNSYLSTPAYNMADNQSGLGGTLGKEAANIGKSALKFGKGVVDFLNPVENLGKVAQIPETIGGYAQDLGGAAQSEGQAQALEAKAQASDVAHGKTPMQPVAKPTDFFQLQPDLGKAAYESTVPQAGQLALKGEGTKAVQSLAEDPFQLAPALLMLKGALESETGNTTVDEKTGATRPETFGDTKVGKAIDTGISKTGQLVTKPVEYAAGKIGDLTNALVKFGTAQTTGLSPKSISTIFDNPDKFFGKDYKSQYSREAIGEKVSSAIDQRLSDLSATGKEYKTIRNSGETVSIPPDTLQNVLDNFGIQLDKKGNIVTNAESTPMSDGDINSLQKFIDTYGKQDELSANAFLNARKSLSNMAKFDASKTDTSTAMARSLRAAYDALGKDQLTGLQELDAQYAPEVQLLNQIKKDYLKPNGEFKDNALTKLANLSNKGREPVLARLEQIKPGIGKEIAVLNAVEDIANTSGQKVGTYTRAAATGGAYLAGGIPGAVVEAILTHPSVATQIISGFAKLKGVDISGTINKVFNTPINLKPGLTIEDVSNTPLNEEAANKVLENRNVKEILNPGMEKVNPSDLLPNFGPSKDISAVVPNSTAGDVTPPNPHNVTNTGSEDMVTPQPFDPFNGKKPGSTPLSGSIEDVGNKANGFRNALDRKTFDTALAHGDVETVKAMLPDIPAAYVAKFAKNIVKLLGKGAVK